MKYELYKIMKSSNATVTVYKPILTEEEREKRMKDIYKASERILKEQIRAEYEKRKHNTKYI